MPHESDEPVAAEGGTLTWDPQRVVLRERKLTRDECVRAWPELRDPQAVPPPLLPDVHVLPLAAGRPPQGDDAAPRDILDFNKSGAA